MKTSYTLWVILLMVILLPISTCACTKETTPEDTASSEQEQVIKIKPEDLSAEYRDNKMAADLKYTGKLVQIQGVVITTGTDPSGTPYLRLGKIGCEYQEQGIECLFDDGTQLSQLRIGQLITIQGRCDGFLAQKVIVEHSSIVSIP